LCGVPRADQFNWGALAGSGSGTGGSPGCGGGDGDGGGSTSDGGSGGVGFGAGAVNGCQSNRNENRRYRHMLQEDECPMCSAEHLKLVYDTVGDQEIELLEAESKLQICVSEAKGQKGIKSLFPCVLRQSLEILSVALLALEVINCSFEKVECYGDLSNMPGQLNLLIQAGRFQSFLQLALLAFGGALAEDAESILVNTTAIPSLSQLEDFSMAVVNGLSDASEGGRSLSLGETGDLLAVGLEVPAEEDVLYFADTWNRSLNLWDLGVVSTIDLPMGYANGFFDLSEASALIEKFENDRAAVRDEGFAGFGDAWRKGVEGQAFEQARVLAGICANVRIRIRQELTLTRIGFEARLEVSNDGTFALENIAVTLRVNPFGNFTEDATDLFAIGNPDLFLISDVDGSGTLAAKSTGEAMWLMIPYTEAAPEFDTRYDVSGLLVYTIDGVEYQQNLAPDTITVRPDPQLYLTYFHSRVAYADNPFTEDVKEPSLPYHLGLLIENRGYGEALNLKIASSQPEIIENEKGLLVDFTIIGARFGNLPSANTLNINFGTIAPQSNVIGVWDMISTLRGNFYNFSATFEYNGPIDDDRLSLIEEVNIHELTHLVRVTGDHPAMPNSLGYIDDELDDFLVNLRPDVFYIPDTVFTSDTRSRNVSVSSIVGRAEIGEPEYNLNRVFVEVSHNLTFEERSRLHDWVYIQFDDPLANTDYLLQNATRTDVGYTLIEQSNSWQTSWTDYLVGGDIEELDHIHLFDFGVAETYVLEYALQQPVDNLRVIETNEDTLRVAWDPAAGASSSYILIKPTGYSNQYYKVAKEFLQVESHKIRNLIPGTSYTIKVFTGQQGKYETTGAQVIGVTLGNSTCGNEDIDVGEECDDGILNGDLQASNCTSSCFLLKMSSPTASPSSVPSQMHSEMPSNLRSSSTPSAAPSRIPSQRPSQQPTTVSFSPIPMPSNHPNSVPSTAQMPSNQSEPSRGPTSTQKPSNAPSAAPKVEPSPAPSDLPSMMMPSDARGGILGFVVDIVLFVPRLAYGVASGAINAFLGLFGFGR